jgi:CRP-like cAMP-binding protein
MVYTGLLYPVIPRFFMSGCAFLLMREPQMPDLHTTGQNHLLAALPAAEYERLSPHLELVQIQVGDVLCESGGELRYAYFPTTAIVSLLYVLEDGASAEIAGVGNEGILGVALLTGGETMPNLAMVQCAGHAYRLKSQLLKDEFNRAGALQHLLLRYTQALITQMSQTVVCNRHHSVEQQVCRWLLLSLDRSPSNELTITQELIASTLGVRREGITEAAGKLQHAGFICYRRGHITVLDRSGLEKRACECYRAVKTEFDRLIHNVTATQAVEPRWMRTALPPRGTRSALPRQAR